MRFVNRMICVLVLFPSVLLGGDWPQILGPHRNGVSEDEKLADKWPADGPPVLWERPVGSGLAGISVSDGRAFIFDRSGSKERLEAVDAVTGESRWQVAWQSDYQDTIAGDDGPRAVPVVHKEFVYAYGAGGTLSCHLIKDGQKVWSRNLVEDYQADLGYFGAGSTPLVEGELLIVNVGGMRTRAAVVALHLETGKEAWKSIADNASYSSPIAATVDGVRHLFVITRLKFVSLDPADGKVRFEFPFGQRGPTVNGANPVLFHERILLTSSYGIGATLARIQGSSAEREWEGDEILSSQYTTPVPQGDVVFAIDGRQDLGQASLKCFEPLTRRVRWVKEGFGMATLILADQKLLCMQTNGTLVLLQASSGRYQELDRRQIFDSTCRALPALANGRLYVRDTQTVKCLNLRPVK